MHNRQLKKIPKFDFESLEPSATGKTYEGLTGDGILYLIENRSLRSFKIGITSPNSTSSRIAAHSRNGWRLIEIYSTKSMQVAFEIEQAVIDWWRRELRLWQSVESSNMPQGGATETVSSEQLSLGKLIAFIEELLKQDSFESDAKSDLSTIKIGSLVKFRASVVSSRLDADECDELPKRNKKSKPTKIKKPVVRATVAAQGRQLLIEKHLYRLSFWSNSRLGKDDFLILGGQELEIKGRIFPIDEKANQFGLLNPQTFHINANGEPVIDNRSPKERVEERICGCGGIVKHKTTTKAFLKFDPRVVDSRLVCLECGKNFEWIFSHISCGTCSKGRFGYWRTSNKFACSYCSLELDSGYLSAYGQTYLSRSSGYEVPKPKNTAEWEKLTGEKAEIVPDWQYEMVDPDSEPDYL